MLASIWRQMTAFTQLTDPPDIQDVASGVFVFYVFIRKTKGRPRYHRGRPNR